MSCRFAFSILVVPVVSVCLFAQGVEPYPNAVTNRDFYAQTPMAPPSVNTVFQDPDFGSTMVRVTDANSNPKQPDSYFRNPADSVNEWSADNSKFYVVGFAANLAFGFDPSTMNVSPLAGAGSGGALEIPLRQGPTFSFVDPDLMYGTEITNPLTIASYRFSTGQTTPVLDTTTCGTQPALVAGPTQFSSDNTLSNDDSRIVISAGGDAFGSRPFVIVYDQQLGCRWYNTQTGQIGGQWGPTGQIIIPDKFSVGHTKISGSGQYVYIGVADTGFYVWDIASLTVTPCIVHDGPECGGYGIVGYNDYINSPNDLDELNIFLRPLGDLSARTQLLNPLPKPYYNGMEKTFAWNDGAFDSGTLPPVCGVTYSPKGNPDIAQPYDGEVFCIETDGLAPTVWRFAHHRAIWEGKEFYWTQPYGNMSLDGRFFAFTSSWDEQLGTFWVTAPRTDVFILELD